ncbi:lipopolysaccharide biosynthesis protein [Vibrio artabrorum]|uniref:lipopolysaccharide biosynthesis protein n=1 Tax=Vibrio artabrorum TaxID=446374 RepID=UPI0021C3421A|nr:oligosaccharide flippase family protein [Vibrio artabrorum]
MSLLKSISTIATSSILSQLIGAGSIWLISHWYGMSEVGSYALTYSIALIGAQVCTFASQLLLPKQPFNELGQNLSFCFWFSVCASLVYSASIAWFFDRPILQILILTLAHAWVLISENLLLRDQKMTLLALQRTSISMLVLLLISISGDLSTFYWAWGASLLVYMLLCIGYSLPKSLMNMKLFSLSPVSPFFRKHKHHIVKVGSAEVLAMVTNNLPVILINVWFSPVVAGYYAVVSRFCLAPIVIVGNAVRNSIFSSWSVDFRHSQFNYAEFSKVRRLLFVLGTVAVVGVFIFYPIVMQLGFNAEWVASVPTSRYLLPYLFMALAVCPLTVLELVYGSPRYFLRIQLEQFVVVLLAFGALPFLIHDYAYSVIAFSVLSSIRYLFIYVKVNKTAVQLRRTMEMA